MTVWTLEQALELVRSLQPLTRNFNYHVTLGGGVLNTGTSKKDLDLYFLPMDNGKPSRDADLRTALAAMFGAPKPLRGKGYSNEGSAYSHKDEMCYCGKRIDVFIIPPAKQQKG